MPMVRPMPLRMFCRRIFLAALLTGFAAAEAPPASARPVVVELFTSQGCSSCPPADKLLTELAGRPDVIALSLPITYWDMLGWKDTLASEANTRRQKAYAQALGRRGIYTPQVIVDGTIDVVGSRRQEVLDAIAARSSAERANVPVTVANTPDEVRIGIAGLRTHKGDDATIWMLHTLSRIEVAVVRGENEGRKLSYSNVVRDLKAVGTWRGEAVTLDLPKRFMASAEHDGLVVLVQQGGHGPILGAAMIGVPGYRPGR